jgi:hypothetical protein
MNGMPYSREQLEYLQNFDRMSALRDMRHMPGWPILCDLAEQRIQHMMASYLKEDATAEEIVERHRELKAVMKFFAMLREMVDEAVNFCDPREVELALYSLSQNSDLY